MGHYYSPFLLLQLHILLTLLLLGSTAPQEITVNNSTTIDVEACMEQEELLGLFEVMGALLEDTYNWAQMHPHPCTDTPWPGIQCGVVDQFQDPLIFHVTKLHIGPDVLASPVCKTTANLSQPSLLKLPFLKSLSIFNCFVSTEVSLSPSLFNSFSSLEQIVFKSNPNLGGLIPHTIADVTTLRVLCLSQNSLQGEIPNEIGKLWQLEQLDFSYNHLTGSVPQEIGQLSSLTILDLSFNNFQGQVPNSLGQFTSIQKIDLSFNSIGGEIPKKMGNLRNLILLDLSHNYLQGPLPETLLGLKGLQYLILDNNPINSELPNFLGALCNLVVMSFSNCGLLGEIPTSFADLGHLSALSLDRNRLSGSVPTKLGALPHLGQLNLSQNQLSGEVFFTDDVVERLGKRLDVRGNSGLCRSHEMHKKFYQILNIPDCLDSSSSHESGGGGVDDDQYEKLKPNLVSGRESSNSAFAHQTQSNKFVFILFLFCLYVL
ncbi:hypothetical protein Sjap_006027 [Stephania japonica]|uniref:Disease resistance R13L4/SHOC-2-like LRR domain-containing protein n=1 Tax=Stephania japonica TaxID=461633 RepID=A0AAP0PKN3_9MAGN